VLKSRITKSVCCLLLCGTLCFSLSTPSSGHGIFKKTLEKQVEGLKVTCFACHVKKKPKSERNKFGQLFMNEFDGEDFTAKWKALEDDKEGRDKFELEKMKPAFLEAFKTIGKKENEDGEKYAELIAEGKIKGTKLKKKKK